MAVGHFLGLRHRYSFLLLAIISRFSLSHIVWIFRCLQTVCNSEYSFSLSVSAVTFPAAAVLAMFLVRGVLRIFGSAQVFYFMYPLDVPLTFAVWSTFLFERSFVVL